MKKKKKNTLIAWGSKLALPRGHKFYIGCHYAKIFKSVIHPFNLIRNKPLFLSVCSTTLLKTVWEKEKLLWTSNFSCSHTVIYPLGGLFIIFIKFRIFVCKLFQFQRVLFESKESNFVLWERVKSKWSKIWTSWVSCFSFATTTFKA